MKALPTKAAPTTAPSLDYAILELGLRCNLHCVHCAVDAGAPRPEELDLASWLAVLDDLDALDCGSVDLMGGEILLSPLLEPIARALAERDRRFGILTNGWLFDEARAAWLLEQGCRGVGISLDGATAQTHDRIRGRAGAFDRALAAIAVLRGLDLAPQNRAVLTSVNTLNIDDLPAMGELLSHIAPGFRWQLNLSSAEAPRLEQHYRLDAASVQRVIAFIEQARRSGCYDLAVTAAHDVGYFLDDRDLHDHDWRGCPAGIHHVGIQSDGLVKGCLALDASFGVGNVKERPLRELWRDAALMARYREVDTAALGPGCRECVWGTICKGGCTAYSSALTGHAHDHPHCLWREASPEERAETERTFLLGDHGEVSLPEDFSVDGPDDDEDVGQHDEDGDEDGDQDSDWPLPLRSVCIELTLRCNLACTHCGQAAGRGRPREFDLADFVPLFSDLYRLGCQRVILLGGEPLLFPDWSLVVTMAAQFGFEVALISNGALIKDAQAEELARLPLSHVGISVDGASDAVHDGIRGMKGARRRTFDAIERLRARGVAVTVITTVSRDNIHELAALRAQLAGKGLLWQLQTANGQGERFLRETMIAPAQLVEIARLIEETRQDQRAGDTDLHVAGAHTIGHHGCTVTDYGTRGRWQGCPGGITSAGIQSDGALKGCLSMGADEIVGSIFERSLLELWRDPESFSRLRAFRPGALQGGCARCPHGATCRGACPEMARAGTGTPWDNPFCLRQAEQAEAELAETAP